MTSNSNAMSPPGFERRKVLRFAAGAALAMALPAHLRAAEPALRLSAFRTAEDAFEAWGAQGGTLTIDRDAVISRPITVVGRSDNTYRLVAQGARTLRYVGPRFHWALCLYSEGRTPIQVLGPLTIDGANRVSMPLFVRFETVDGSARRDCTVEGLAVRNARMEAGRSTVDGSPTNAYGASGMLFAGGFDRLVLRNVSASNVTRAAGAGRAGSQGCAGIAVTGDPASTRSARHVLIEDFVIDVVDSEDPFNSPHRGDMDGVLVFQAPEAGGSRPIIQRGTIRNAAGRAVKVFAPGGGGVTQDLSIVRSRPGGRFGSVDIAHQHGDGTIRNIRIDYSGSAHTNPTTSIGFSSGTARDPRFPFGPAVVENVSIEDTTRVPKYALFGLQYNVGGDARTRSFRATGVTDRGRSRYLFLPGALGTQQSARVEFEQVDVDLTAGVFASEDPTQRLVLALHDVRLTRGSGRVVPAKVLYDDRRAPPGVMVRALRAGTVSGLE